MKGIFKKPYLTFLNNINLSSKMFFVTFVGAFLPMVILVGFYSWQIFLNYDAREEVLVEGITRSITSQIEVALDTVQSSVYSYTSNVNINRAIATPDLYSEDDMGQFFEDIAKQTLTDTMSEAIIKEIKVYTKHDHLLDLESIYYNSEILEGIDWYEEFLGNPQYLRLVTGFEGENPSLTMIKSFNSFDFFAQDILFVVLENARLEDILNSELLEGFDGDVYLLDPEGNIVISTDHIYGTGDKNLKTFSDLSLDESAHIITKSISDEHHLLGWEIKFHIKSSTARQTLNRQLISIFIGAVIVMLILTTVNYTVAKSIVSRLRHINNSMEKTEGEELSIITENLGNDEISETAGHFNEMVERIQDLIHVDMLTRMMNRFAIIENAKRQIKEEADGLSTAIIFVDVDNFKNINDTYGHDLGDLVIIETSNRLKQVRDSRISIGRFGGDEFILVVKDIRSHSEIATIGNQLREAFKMPFLIKDKTFHLTISAGAALYPTHGQDINDLVKKADLALYEAKDLGRDQLVVYSSQLDQELEEELTFQNEVKESFAREDFYMNYQPYYDAKDDSILGFEALIRWYSDVYGQVSPYKLITNIEEMGLIVEVGSWVIEQCFKFAAEINLLSETPIAVSVNISIIQLMHGDFYEMVMSLVEKTGVNPEVITLEMTETVLIESIESSISIVEKLAHSGFNISIDDFGTGYSSLGYLKRLPANQVKIDRGFVETIDTSPFDRALIESVTSLAHMRNMAVVAEGVETESQKSSAIAYGCDMLQGFLLNKPMEREKAIDLVKKC